MSTTSNNFSQISETYLQLIATFSGLLETSDDKAKLQEKFEAFGKLTALLSYSTDETQVQYCKALIFLATKRTYTVDELLKIAQDAPNCLHEALLDEASKLTEKSHTESSQEQLATSVSVPKTLRILQISFREVLNRKQSAKVWQLDTPVHYGEHIVLGGKFLYFQPSDEHRRIHPELTDPQCVLLTSLVVKDSNNVSRLRSLKHFSHDDLYDLNLRLQKIVGPFYFKF